VSTSTGIGPRDGPQAAQHFEAVHLRQADVEDHQVELLVRRREHRFLAARRDVDRVTLCFEDALQTGSEGCVVFDDQESHGSVKALWRK
jgi:hypothetical protein